MKASDFLITNIEPFVINGIDCKIFNVSIMDVDGPRFVGRFSAPAETDDANLYQFYLPFVGAL